MVLVFWVAVFAVAGPLAGKLNSAQQNDSSAWLPNNAESTQVVELAKRFSTDDSGRFVNGVLASIARIARPSA